MAVVGMVVHGHQDDADAVALDLIEWLDGRDHEVRLTESDAGRLGRPELALSDDRFAAGLDVALSLGGDGTMLRTAALVEEESTPIIGINLGQLGYLTSTDSDGARMAMKRFLAGSYEVEPRMLVSATVEGSGRRWRALNEAVIEKTQSGHTVRLAVSVDGEEFTTYACDGLIVATPTGSTAYSFSARGPIVSPAHRCLVLTPVSPHMLFDRSLVLAPDAVVRLEVIGHRSATVSVDGREVAEVGPGDALVCTAASRSANLVSFGDQDFLGVLKAKFGLSDR